MGEYSVYKHTAPNGKVYIGITCQKPNKRWGRGSNYKTQRYFSSAIKKYGWGNITHEILFTALTKEEAEQKEIELIAEYNSTNRQYGYNIENGGNAKGKCSEETKQRISNSNKGHKMSDEQKNLLRKIHLGRKPTPDENRKRSAGVKASWTPEKRKNMSNRVMGKANCNYGRIFTEIEIKHLQEKCRGKNSSLSKKVGQFDLEGNLIRTFDSAREAGRNGFTTQGITGVCRGEKHTHKGYIWKYMEANGGK